MNTVLVCCLIVCMVTGCMTLQPVPANPSALQPRIAAGALLKRGDYVVIRTQDGRTHDFNVTSISASTIEGRHESISIDQITFIQKRKLDVGKTALAVGLTVVAAAAIAVLAVCSVGAHRSSTARVPQHSARFAQPAPPPLLLHNPSQNGNLQTCEAPGGETKGQKDDGASAHCASLHEVSDVPLTASP
jgi:hypothetical protein